MSASDSKASKKAAKPAAQEAPAAEQEGAKKTTVRNTQQQQADSAEDKCTTMRWSHNGTRERIMTVAHASSLCIHLRTRLCSGAATAVLLFCALPRA